MFVIGFFAARKNIFCNEMFLPVISPFHISVAESVATVGAGDPAANTHPGRPEKPPGRAGQVQIKRKTPSWGKHCRGVLVTVKDEFVLVLFVIYIRIFF